MPQFKPRRGRNPGGNFGRAETVGASRFIKLGQSLFHKNKPNLRQPVKVISWFVTIKKPQKDFCGF
jgi:hypothetical protein